MKIHKNLFFWQCALQIKQELPELTKTFLKLFFAKNMPRAPIVADKRVWAGLFVLKFALKFKRLSNNWGGDMNTEIHVYFLRFYHTFHRCSFKSRMIFFLRRQNLVWSTRYIT